jgi:hypothetical protein
MYQSRQTVVARPENNNLLIQRIANLSIRKSSSVSMSILVAYI